MKFWELISDEFHQTMRKPLRLSRFLEKGKLAKFFRFQRSRLISKDDWIQENTQLRKRNITSYENYITLQRSKLEHVDLSSHEKIFRKMLYQRLQTLPWLQSGMRVLCLGARLGAEVAAFRDAGCFAVGIDLNPGQDNSFVLYDDFHNLSFPDKCVDVIYTNSLDHSFDLNKVFKEISRVLTDESHIIVEADPGTSEDENSVTPDIWATLEWPSIEALCRSIEEFGFSCQLKDHFGYPRKGTRLIFTP